VRIGGKAAEHGSEPQIHSPRSIAPREQSACLGPDNALERPLPRFEEDDLNAQPERRRGDLGSDEAGADNHQPETGPKVRPKGEGIGQRTKRVDAARRGPAKLPRTRAGCEHEGVPHELTS
jgi:hypothetical protein